MISEIRQIQSLLHDFLNSALTEGDIVVDATAGRGRDTLFLAQCVGASGKVYAFDIQQAALTETKGLLLAHDMAERVQLFGLDHARMGEMVQEKIQAVIFNLGYLPGGDHHIVTQPESTMKGIQAGLTLLKKSGVLVLTVYRGHSGALAEAEQVHKFLSSLPKKEFSVLEGHYINQGDNSPYWVIVQKTGEGWP